MQINGRTIGLGERPYLIAEMSGNHNHSLDRALEIVTSAAEHGADAIKLQTYTADTITLDLDGPGFTIEDDFGQAAAAQPRGGPVAAGALPPA